MSSKMGASASRNLGTRTPFSLVEFVVMVAAKSYLRRPLPGTTKTRIR